jgi:hypothetical protein
VSRRGTARRDVGRQSDSHVCRSGLRLPTSLGARSGSGRRVYPHRVNVDARFAAAYINGTTLKIRRIETGSLARLDRHEEFSGLGERGKACRRVHRIPKGREVRNLFARPEAADVGDPRVDAGTNRDGATRRCIDPARRLQNRPTRG